MDKFAERLKALRIDRNLTQVQLAFDTKISHSAIAYWEKCERQPNAQAIITLAKYFGVSADYLLGLKDD